MEELSLADYLAILKWRKRYFFLAFAVLWACSLAFALVWSNYRSAATVEVEQPQVAPDMTVPLGTSPGDVPESLADLRISKIEEKVTAPASLIEIITKFDLYPNTRRLEPIAAVADRMRNKIKLDLIGSTIVNPAATEKVSADQLSAIAFTLSFDYSDPETAQKVANELVTRFLDEDLKERRAEAEATSTFLGTQIAALESSMADQEKKIADFEEKHGVARPEALLFNQQAAETTVLSMQGLDSQIASNEGTQGSLRAQLATVDPYSRVIANGQVLTTPETQLKALEAQYATLTAQYGPDHPDIVKVRNQIAALRKETGVHRNDTSQLKAQIKDVRTNLKAAEKTYGPDNPDVIALQHQLGKLEDRLKNAGPEEAEADIKKDADNPAYLELVAQLKSAEEQHKSLMDQREELVRQQAKYQEAVAADPALEQQMAELSRDYDNAQGRYRELKEKKMAADMDVQMVQDRQGQRLVVINPPELPLKTHPSRVVLLLAGFLLSVMGGFGAVFLVQNLHHSILGTRHLTSLVGVAPLVAIPHIYTKGEIARRHRRKPLAVGTAVIAVAAMAALINFQVMPLDVLWSVFAQRLGLS